MPAGPCPTCRSQLQFPRNAERVTCPRCGAVYQVLTGADGRMKLRRLAARTGEAPPTRPAPRSRRRLWGIGLGVAWLLVIVAALAGPSDTRDTVIVLALVCAAPLAILAVGGAALTHRIDALPGWVIGLGAVLLLVVVAVLAGPSDARDALIVLVLVCATLLVLFVVARFVIARVEARPQGARVLHRISTAILGLCVVLVLLSMLQFPAPLPSVNPVIPLTPFALNTMPGEFCKALRERVQGAATVNSCRGWPKEHRFVMEDVDLTLTTDRNRGAALHMIELALRHYAAIAGDQAAYIFVRVEWKADTFVCATGAGMGYLVMESIDWARASQADIFHALDQEIYGDLGEHYSRIAWTPGRSGVAACNR